MIITVVCDVLGEENNGTTVAAMNLIKFLQQKGHTVRILCADQARKNQENVFVVPNYNFGKILNDYVHKVGVTLAKPHEEIVRNAIDGADIVHIMMPLSLGIFAAKIAHEQNVPITAGFHMQAENLTSYLKLNKVKVANKLVYKTIYNNVYQYADGIEAITCGKLTIVSDSELSATKGFAVDERCVFKNRKPKDLAKVIDFWISHPTEKEACENKFLAYSSRFNQERCMDEMNQFFSSVYEKTKTDKEVNA